MKWRWLETYRVKRCLSSSFIEEKTSFCPTYRAWRHRQTLSVQSRGGSSCFCRDGLLLADVNVKDKNIAVRLVDLVEGACPCLLIITSLDESTCLLRGSNSWLAIIDTIHRYFFLSPLLQRQQKQNKTKRRASFSRLKPHLRNIIDRLAAIMQKNDRMNGYLGTWVNEWINEWIEGQGMNGNVWPIF